MVVVGALCLVAREYLDGGGGDCKVAELGSVLGMIALPATLLMMREMEWPSKRDVLMPNNIASI